MLEAGYRPRPSSSRAAGRRVSTSTAASRNADIARKPANTKASWRKRASCNRTANGSGGLA